MSDVVCSRHCCLLYTSRRELVSSPDCAWWSGYKTRREHVTVYTCLLYQSNSDMADNYVNIKVVTWVID